MNALACGAGAPAREKLAPRTIVGISVTIFAAIVSSLNLLTAALQEIFDESAYQRFLLRHQLPSSASAYSEFYREHAKARTGPTKCC